MKAEFSEFTYGYSLVHELVDSLSCTAVPIFPSLIEEGKKGGGYDAKLLSKKGKLLYLQFKLSDWMKARNAREYKIRGHSLSLPYYRFEITSRRISKQHKLLLALESVEPLTFYAAPAFHLIEEINAHWNQSSATPNSVFVKPRSIGNLYDYYTHRVCFDATLMRNNRAYLFSDPQEIEVLPFQSLLDHLIAEVDGEIDTLENSFIRAREQFVPAIEKALAMGQEHVLRVEDPDESLLTLEIESSQLQKQLDYDLWRLEQIASEPADGVNLLRQIAEISSVIFGSQAIALVK